MRLPVSVKGVLLSEGRVVLLKNEREEWELPGGRLEKNESPRQCVEREVFEELNLRVEAGPLLDARVFEVVEGRRVFIVAYGCRAESFDGMRHGCEHAEVGVFRLDELEGIALPAGYREAIYK